MAKISQREARRLRKRVTELEDRDAARRRAWSHDYVGGTQIGGVKWDKDESRPVAIRTARKLGHAVVVTAADDGSVYFFALKVAEI